MSSENTAPPEANSGAETANTPAITFDDLGLSEDTLRAVKEGGYNTPTPIQAQAIPEVLKGRDILGIAQTGTGKTAAFVLPMIDILAAGRARARMPRTLILEPTRELAAQVAENFDKYGKYQKLTKALLIGGVSFGDQDALLARGVDVLIATPGRLLDHFERGKLLLTGVQVMVVDEADRMLDMGFIPDIERIFKLTPFTRQTLFFSATMPPEITRLTEQFLSSPKRIEAAKPATAATTIEQRIIPLPGGDPRTRRAALRAVMQSINVRNGIVFCNRKTDVDVVALSLEAPRLQRLAHPRRSRTKPAHQDARPLPLRRSAVSHRLRRGGARLGYSRRQPRLQLRAAAHTRRLHPPHRPHRPRRQARRLVHAVRAERSP